MSQTSNKNSGKLANPIKNNSSKDIKEPQLKAVLKSRSNSSPILSIKKAVKKAKPKKILPSPAVYSKKMIILFQSLTS